MRRRRWLRLLQRRRVQRAGELVEAFAQGADLVDVEAGRARDAARYFEGALAQGDALVGEPYVDRAFVAGAALTSYQTGRLQSFEQRGQGAGVEAQVFAELLDGQL